MGMIDDMKDKAKDMMDDPDQRAKIEKYAKDHNITVDEAKSRLMKHNDR